MMMTARSIVQELIRYVGPPRGTAIAVNEALGASVTRLNDSWANQMEGQVADLRVVPQFSLRNLYVLII